MNIFGDIGHFFKSLFGRDSVFAEKVLHEAAAFVSLATPIVEEVETGVKASAAADPSAKLTAISTFLGKYEPDVAKVENTVATLAALPPANLWHSLAVTALAAVAPTNNTNARLLNLGVELAYNIFKSKSTAVVGTQVTTTPAVV